MASEIIDIDAIVPDTFEVRMKGKTYSFPKSVMLDRALAMMKETDEIKGSNAGGLAAIDKNFEFLAGIFKEHGYEDVTADFLRSTLTLQQGMTLMNEMIDKVLSIKGLGKDGEKEGNP